MSNVISARFHAARGFRNDVAAGCFLLNSDAKRLHDLLYASRLSVRISVHGNSQTIGFFRKNAEDPIEFRFESADDFEFLISRLRLYDFAMAYFDGRLQIVGDLARAADILFTINLSTDAGSSFREKIERVVFRCLKAVIPAFARKFESDAHYALDAAAYELFLDPYMQYTCGKFVSGRETIAEAQINKFELVANLIRENGGRLEGRKHLDIGCGWGGLIGYFQKFHSTLSTGVANSAQQVEYAKKRFHAEAILGDFADLPASQEMYDLITVVGMAEHLTPHRRTHLFKVVSQRLRPRGFVYFQCIAKPQTWIGGDAYRIAFDLVFPGHFLETRVEMENRFEELGFRVLHAVDDAADYAHTTKLWAKSLEANELEITEKVGARNLRVLVGYLTYASKLFASDRGSLMRYLLQKM